MAKDLVTKVGIDAVDSVNGAKIHNKMLGSMGNAMRQQVKELARVKGITDKLIMSAEGLNKKNERVTATFKVMNGRAYILASTLEKVTAVEKKLEIATAKVGTTQSRVATQYQTASNRMMKSNKDMILSAKGVERILAILLIRRTFHLLITKMREATTAIMDFHKALTEIQTIAQDNQASMDRWADSIARVAIAWDVELLDAANARYEILSNQIAKGAAATETFSQAAFKFAKITKSTATDSVNLLTAALNAYGLIASDTEEISAKLFKTIELGRIRSSDLANTMGRALVPAAQLGIEFEDLAAMMATITIKGVKATESMTLLRGVMVKLMKPTKGMMELFKQWGVRTGEQAIATYGLYGVMQKLEEATRGTASEIAELFGRIRATMGVTAVISDLEKFQETLAAIRDTSMEAYTGAAAMQFQTAGEQVSRAMNELQIYFTRSFGGVVIEELAAYNRGTITIVNTIVFLTENAIKLGVVLGTMWTVSKLIAYGSVLHANIILYSSYTAAVHNAAKAEKIHAIAASTRGAIIKAAITASILLLISYIQKQREIKRTISEISHEYDIFANSQKSALAVTQSEYTKTIDALKETTQATYLSFANLSSAINQAIIDIEAKMEADEEWLKEHQKAIQLEISTTVKEYTGMYKTLTKMAEEYQKTIDKLQEQKLKTAENIAAEIENVERSFLTPKEDIKRLKDQYAETLAIAQSTSGTHEERVKNQEKLLELAKEIYKVEKSADEERQKEAHRLASERNRRMRLRAPRKPQISGRREYGEDYLARLEEARKISTDVYDDAIAKQQEFYDNAKVNAETVAAKYREILDLVNQVMERLGKPTVAGLEEAEEARKRLVDIVEKGGTIKLDIGDLASQMAEFVERFDIVEPLKLQRDQLVLNETALSKNTDALTRTLEVYRSQIKGFDDSIKTSKDVIKTGIPTLVEQLDKTSVQTQKMMQDLVDQTTAGKLDIRVLQQTFDAIRTYIDKARVADGTTALNLEQQYQFIRELPGLLEQMMVGYKDIAGADPRERRKVETEEIERFHKAVHFYREQITVLTNAMETAIDAEAKRPAVEEKIVALDVSLAQMLASNNSYLDLMKPFLEGVDKLNKEELVLLKTYTSDFAEEMRRLAAAIRTMELGAKATPITRALGGSVWGTDTVPTRTTPGEFIVNQRSARRFYGQLLSMNNGGMSQGGDYSTKIGDISIGVTGGDTSRQTLQGIVSGLRREIHRGKLARI